MNKQTPPLNVSTPVDELLLERIATERDREAFRLLVERLGKPAFNLSFHLIGNRAQAEDVVQEALLNIWSSAQRFDPSRGTARAWILCIVANKSLKIGTKTKRESVHNQKRSDLYVRNPMGPDQEFQKAELFGALREMLTGLSSLDRKLVTLYYGGELTQEQIAEALSIPQPTVSLRIRQAVKHLRNALTTAGFAIATPVLIEGLLGEALLTGEEVPAGFLENMATSVQGLDPNVSPVTSGVGSASSLVFAGACCSALLGIGVFWLSSPANVEGGKAGASSSQALKTNTLGLAVAPLHKVWTFSDGLPNDILFLHDRATWVPPQNGNVGVLRAPEHALVEAKFLYALPATPVLLKVKARLGNMKNKKHADWNCGALSFCGEIPPKVTKFHRFLKLDEGGTADPKKLRTQHYYFVGRYIIGSLDGEINIILRFEKGHKDWRAGVVLKNWDVEEITLDELREEDVPVRMRDPEALIQTITFRQEEITGYTRDFKRALSTP